MAALSKVNLTVTQVEIPAKISLLFASLGLKLHEVINQRHSKHWKKKALKKTSTVTHSPPFHSLRMSAFWQLQAFYQQLCILWKFLSSTLNSVLLTPKLGRKL